MSPPKLRPKTRSSPKAQITASAPEEISVSNKMVDAGTHQRFRPIFSTTAVFSVLLAVRLLSAAFATIPDCDEVFNYWEPTHYLAHGYGLQTWEYSPVYAIRSWAYVGLHAILSRGASLFTQHSKVHEFYALRTLFAVFSTYCETHLYSAISININRMVGLLYLIASTTSAGMFQATASFLPSTFAMYTTMLGMAAFIDRRRGSRTAEAIFWFAVGGLLGWPFSMAMCVPFVLEELLVGIVSSNRPATLIRLLKGGLASLLVLAAIVGVDYAAYRKLEIVPLNIVLYNVFSGADKGPALYGTEPWWFYLANLTLNFNLLLPLSMLAGPLLVAYYMGYGKLAPGFTPRMLTISIPFYLWFLIFTAQPHKEERFMFVAYPALCLNAAVAYHVIISVWGALSRGLPSGKPREVLNWTVLVLPLFVTTLVSLSRALSVVTAYSAPLQVYDALPQNSTGNLCIGKEWYRFPSSYFLPDGVRVKFVKSRFDGLLPGEFPENQENQNFWERPGTWMIPKGMNDLNIGDPSKYVTFDTCDFLVESYFGRNRSEDDETYRVDPEEWEQLVCKDFMDATKTPTIGRVLWVPNVRSWGQYCLFRRKEDPTA